MIGILHGIYWALVVIVFELGLIVGHLLVTTWRGRK